ncbi:MAG: glycosyltransferase [Erysipelotrichaceae bacterium]|nr:glycosyltransferase [Erysipelotrichaceae bacterium]
MKIIAINLGCFGSTGTIMSQIAHLSRECGIDYYCVYPDSSLNKNRFESDFITQKKRWWLIETKISHLLGLNDLLSFLPTKRVIRFLKKEKPDIVHLHNIHNCFLNYPLLFSFLSKKDIHVVWTLHDCWSFTGRCPYFSITKCEQWKSNCSKCIYNKRYYPKSFIRTEKLQLKLKKHYFSLLNHMTIVTPSKWLSDLVKQSFLCKYPTRVIYNGIDFSVFKPQQSDCKRKYKINNNRFVLLGVAFDWGYRKGLDVFVKLSKVLDDKFYQIVIVGTNSTIDKSLPSNIVSIHQTESKIELAQLYSTADLFINPTREDNLPTVNIESLACGTPVLSFRTGGSPEIIDKTCGSIVDCDDFESLKNEIIRICKTKPYSKDNCLKRAKVFDMNVRFQDYICLYEELNKKQ